jgi:hypothetical protein
MGKRRNIMAKMSALNIEQTNKFVGALDEISQFIDEELIPEISVISILHERLIILQKIVNDYRDEVKGNAIL